MFYYNFIYVAVVKYSDKKRNTRKEMFTWVTVLDYSPLSGEVIVERA